MFIPSSLLRSHPDVLMMGARQSAYAQTPYPVGAAELVAYQGRLRIRCAELDTTIRGFLVSLLNHELSADGGAIRNGAKHKGG